MQYALVNGLKSLPAKGLKGRCLGCKNDVIAKCGNIKVHHWAHAARVDCDPWSEPETEWHRDWKNNFPEEFREKHFVDEVTNEIHRADIHTPTGITIEFQNSPISTEEFGQRNTFYKKLIWVVNAAKFKGSFEFLYSMPNPESRLLDEYIFTPGNFLHFFRKEEYIKDQGGLLLSLDKEELKHISVSAEYWKFKWKHKHNVWYQPEAVIFFDFGQEFLYWLKCRKQVDHYFWYVQIVHKKKFIDKYSRQ